MYEAMAAYPALWDVWEEVADIYAPSDFDGVGFSEIWLMDDGYKYTSRRDPLFTDFARLSVKASGHFAASERKRQTASLPSVSARSCSPKLPSTLARMRSEAARPGVKTSGRASARARWRRT